MIKDEQFIYKMMFKAMQRGVYGNPAEVHVFNLDSKNKTGFMMVVCLN